MKYVGNFTYKGVAYLKISLLPGNHLLVHLKPNRITSVQHFHHAIGIQITSGHSRCDAVSMFQTSN